MKPSLVMIGGGGHCAACADVIEQESRFHIDGIIDPADPGEPSLGGYPILGTDEDIAVFVRKGHWFLVTVGQIRTSQVRQRLFGQVRSLGGQLATVISPKAYVSPRAEIGQGSIVMHRAVINAGAVVGDNCIINTGAIVEHGACVGSHCHISTGAILNGGVCVGAMSFIGSRSMVSHGIKIGEECLVGGGVSIFKDIADRGLIKYGMNDER